MYFPLYLVALGISAGIVGAFGRRLVALGGYVADFESGISVVIMVGCAYIAVQAAYGGFIQLIKPFKSKSPHLTECLSQLAALVLIPFLLDVDVPWPHPKLAELEPAIYLMAFAGVHVFFKLATLFAATQAIPATQIRVVPYVVIVAIACLGTLHGFDAWYGSLKGIRTATPEAPSPVRVGSIYADARRLAEGLQYPMGTLPGKGMHLTMRWANLADTQSPLETIFVTCNFFGDDPDLPLGSVTQTLALSEDDWFEFRVQPERIPDGAVTYTVFWNLDEEPEWVRRTGVRPAFTSGKEMLLSGPFAHPAPATFGRPNVVVLLVEGLGADHMELLGYKKETSPKMALLAGRSVLWENAFTPCPDTLSTTLSIFSGLPPLMHGNTGAATGALPPGAAYLPELFAEAGYATVAFTEGEGTDARDLVFDTGVERGFQLFDPVFPQETLGKSGSGPAPLVPKGARETLQRAAEWIRDHREQERFLMFIRLRELRKPFALKRYGQGYIKPWESVPQPIDVYDTALLDVDKQIGLFIDRLAELGSLDDTCIVLTSPYGLDFSEPERAVWRRGGPGVPRLTEESLHVPLIISLPEGIGRIRRGMVTLDALGATLADLGGVGLTTGLATRSLLEFTPTEDPISVFGDPVELSVRTETWRMNWQSGLRPVSFERVAPARPVGLYNIPDYWETNWNKDFQQREPQAARALTNQLENYIRPYVEAAGVSP